MGDGGVCFVQYVVYVCVVWYLMCVACVYVSDMYGSGQLFSVAVTAEVRLPEQETSYRTNEFHFTFRCPSSTQLAKV